MTDKYSIALVGAGAMGGALFKGWLKGGSMDVGGSAVFDPAPPADMRALCEAEGVALNPPVDALDVDALVAAVKPQAVEKALPAYAPLAENAVVISVMAGKSVDAISKALGRAPRVARAMPNLPAAVGRGVSGLYAGDAIDAKGRALIETLMRAAGETVWVESEGDIDVVTAVSGSGPAYYFLLTEALAEAGAALGLSRDAAAALARATLTGAGALAETDPRAPEEMRRAVTSPGGTTEAALKVLDGEGEPLRELINDAVAAAAKRAGELTD